MLKSFDERMMRRALALARKGRGKVSPNPMVGAVLTKRGLVISTGYHKIYGGKHAEINAIWGKENKVQGATLYVNLEPCSHFGKTPPCVNEIVNSGIKRVVVGMQDPNPLVFGKGLKFLQEKGIDVTSGVLEKDCRRLNEAYIKHVKKKIPFVTLKVALTLDGKIALSSGESKWITSSKARAFTHELRGGSDAVLVGAKTVLKDDPMLNIRLCKKKFKDPLRVVLDSKLRTKKDANVFDTRKGGISIVFTGRNLSSSKVQNFENLGVKVINVDRKKSGLDLKAVLRELGKLGVTNLLVEGGREIFSQFLKQKLADKLILIYGNKIVGGSKSLSPFSGIEVSKLNQAFTLKDLSAINLDSDIVVSGYLR